MAALIFLFYSLFICSLFFKDNIRLPVNLNPPYPTGYITLSPIGKFGELRKARSAVPAHLHTGIDIKRPSDNYSDEPIFPIAKGTVISVRRDGPFAQIIIEHLSGNNKFWTLYEHIAGIRVKNGDMVSPGAPIARFMTGKELNRHGWQFDHLHFEILKAQPVKIKPSSLQPERSYSAYTLSCTTKKELAKYYFNPMEFLNLSHE